MYMQTSTYQQEDHYCSYGGLMGESTGGDIQKYKYNGKHAVYKNSNIGYGPSQINNPRCIFRIISNQVW